MFSQAYFIKLDIILWTICIKLSLSVTNSQSYQDTKIVCFVFCNCKE